LRLLSPHRSCLRRRRLQLHAVLSLRPSLRVGQCEATEEEGATTRARTRTRTRARARAAAQTASPAAKAA
jgi:hypothetical protein